MFQAGILPDWFLGGSALSASLAGKTRQMILYLMWIFVDFVQLYN